MEVITLDDSVENNSLYIIDDTPDYNLAKISNSVDEAPKNVMEELTNRHNQSPRSSKRKNTKKKKNSAKKKKLHLDFNELTNANSAVIGSCSDDSLQTENNSTCSSRTQIDSTISSRNGKKPWRRARKSKNKSETIVILSDDDSAEEINEVISADEINEVIELSDDEVGVGISGGELSTTVSANHLNRCENFSYLKRMNVWPNNNNNNNKKKKKQNIFTPSTSKALSPKNSQVMDKSPVPQPSSSKKSSPHRKLRPIVIDGSNVAFGHGVRQRFSSKGLDICCNYFLSRGHPVKVFIPQFRRRHYATSDTHILDKLEKDNILVFTPSRSVNGKQVISYDDRYIVEYATKCGGIIVSRDNFKDIISENHEWKETIDNRLLMYTWVDDLLMFPNDPLGRSGPTLDEFLSFPPETTSNVKTEKPKPGEIIITK